MVQTWDDLVRNLPHLPPSIFTNAVFQLPYEFRPPDFQWNLIEISFDYIHLPYRNFIIGAGSLTSWKLSRAVEKLSQRIWKYYRNHPWRTEVVELAETLKEMAIEIQIGPPREVFYVMPKPRYPGGRFY